MEDEPNKVYQRLLEAGLVAGSELEVITNETNQMMLRLAGYGEVSLAAEAEAQVDVAPSNFDAASLHHLYRLDELPLGHAGQIVLLSG